MKLARRHRLEAALFEAFQAASRRVPRRLLRSIGRGLGDVAYLADRRRFRVGMHNLDLAYGAALTRAEKRRILHGCWRNWARSAVDMLYFPRLRADRLDSVVRLEGLEHIREAYDRGKGVLLFSGHYGHWELTAYVQGILGMQLSMIVRPLDNRRVERLFSELRAGSGNLVVPKQVAAWGMLRALRAGNGVAILIDQDARDGGIFVPFFGHPASTTPTLARMALRTGATVVPTFSVACRDGTYRTIWEPPVETEPSGDRQADVERLTRRYTAILEVWVRRHPTMWTWVHRRWKTRPAQSEPEATPGNPASEQCVERS